MRQRGAVNYNIFCSLRGQKIKFERVVLLCKTCDVLLR